MSTRSYRARNAAYARWHREPAISPADEARLAEKLARTPDTSRPRHMLDTAPVATEAPFAIGDMVRWQNGDATFVGTIAGFTGSRADVQCSAARLFPRINQLQKVT